MKFLLDTNVVSEPTKPRPNAGVMAWLAQVDEDSVHLSVVSITELRYGIERLAAGARRRQLERWLQHDLPERFTGRILPIGLDVAEACGRIVARCDAAGRTIDFRDAYLSATAEVHGLTLVTRNVSDFQQTSSALFMPWS